MMAGVDAMAPASPTPFVPNGWVVDALRHLGVTDVAMPATPMTVWKTIQAAKGGK